MADRNTNGMRIMAPETDSRYETYRQGLHRARETLALKTVLELGVFEHLLAGPRSAEELAERAGVNPGRLVTFLDYLVNLEFLQREGGLYELVPGDEALLPDHLDDLTTWTVKQTFEDMSRTVDLLVRDEYQPAAGPGHDVTEEERHRFLMSLHHRSRAVAREVADILSERPVEYMADLGCGAGTYTAALLETFPTARAVLVDRETAVPTLARLASTGGYRERIDIRAVDAHTGDFGSGFDLVLISNLLHCYGPDENALLIRRAASRLKSGGRLAVKDFHIEEGYSGPRYALGFRMFLATITRGGDCYPLSVLAQWCGEAGLGSPSSHVLDEAPEARLFVATKP